MELNSRRTAKRIITSFLGLVCGIVSALVGLGIIYLVVFRWLDTIHTLEATGALLVSLWAIGQGGYLIYFAIREVKKSGKDE